jgi:hypothetical protein
MHSEQVVRIDVSLDAQQPVVIRPPERLLPVGFEVIGFVGVGARTGSGVANDADGVSQRFGDFAARIGIGFKTRDPRAGGVLSLSDDDQGGSVEIVNAALDTTTYDRGIKITDKQIAALEATQLHRHKFHGALP